MPSVLFICTANRFRSPLAAAILRKALEEHNIGQAWRVGSAGTWATPGQPVLPNVVEAARTLDLDLTAHRSARLGKSLLHAYDLTLVMQASQKEALWSEFPERQENIYLLSEVVERRTYDIPDTPETEQGAKEIALELNELIRRGFDSICVLSTYLHNKRHQSEFPDG
jgi:protein-tyrosine-phosphatase